MAEKTLIRFALAGASGRMGRAILKASLPHSDLLLVGATEQAGHPLLGQPLRLLDGDYTGELCLAGEMPTERPDVLIDFTSPTVTLGHLAAFPGLPLVIGTTGFQPEEKAKIAQAARTAPIVFAPNMSVGVNLLLGLLANVARVLNENTEVEIIEAHHRYKKDAPSGTALKMGEVIAAARGKDFSQCAVWDRNGKVRQGQDIGFAVIRAGEIIGEHTALFVSPGERLEISHKAESRQTFAEGALRAARWVVNQPSGLFDMQDVLGLKP